MITYLILLYFADIVNTVTIVFCLAAVIYAAVALLDRYVYYEQDTEPTEKIVCAKRIRKNIIKGVVFLLLAVVTPSKGLIYVVVGASAGTEIAEAALNNPTMAKAFEVINIYLDKEIADASSTVNNTE